MVVIFFATQPEGDEFDKPHNMPAFVMSSQFPDMPLDRLLESIYMAGRFHGAIYWYRSSQDYGIRGYVSAETLAKYPNSMPEISPANIIYAHYYCSKGTPEGVPDMHDKILMELFMENEDE